MYLNVSEFLQLIEITAFLMQPVSYRPNGIMEWWNNGMVEYWNGGILECWFK